MGLGSILVQGPEIPQNKTKRTIEPWSFPRGSITKAGPLSMCRSLLWGVQAEEWAHHYEWGLQCDSGCGLQPHSSLGTCDHKCLPWARGNRGRVWLGPSHAESMQTLSHSEQCKEHWTRILMMSVQWTMKPGCSSQVGSPALKGLRKPAGTWPRGSLTPIPERRKSNFVLSSSSKVLTGGIPVPQLRPLGHWVKRTSSKF